MNIVTSDQFLETLNQGIIEDNISNINFNDEIESIEYIGERPTYDINVEGYDHFFYANGVLTHNSATGANLNIQEVDNDSVSDSIGTVQTADFIMFLLQSPTMKEEGIMTCKVTKNRFNGRTDYWDMKIDYTKMKFSDVEDNYKDAKGLSDTQINTELAVIKANDIAIIKKKDNEITEEFDIMGELGL